MGSNTPVLISAQNTPDSNAPNRLRVFDNGIFTNKNELARSLYVDIKVQVFDDDKFVLYCNHFKRNLRKIRQSKQRHSKCNKPKQKQKQKHENNQIQINNYNQNCVIPMWFSSILLSNTTLLINTLFYDNMIFKKYNEKHYMLHAFYMRVVIEIIEHFHNFNDTNLINFDCDRKGFVRIDKSMTQATPVIDEELDLVSAKLVKHYNMIIPFQINSNYTIYDDDFIEMRNLLYCFILSDLNEMLFNRSLHYLNNFHFKFENLRVTLLKLL